MGDTIPILVLTVGDRRVALPLEAVDRVVRAVYVTPLPDAPPGVVGVVNVYGRVLPVLTLRGNDVDEEGDAPTGRAIDPADQFVIARVRDRRVVFWVDRAEVVDCPPSALVPAGHVLRGHRAVRQMMKWDWSLVMVFDLDAWWDDAGDVALAQVIARTERALHAGEAAAGDGAAADGGTA